LKRLITAELLLTIYCYCYLRGSLLYCNYWGFYP